MLLKAIARRGPSSILVGRIENWRARSVWSPLMRRERSEVLVVLVTASNPEEAAKIAKAAVAGRYAACATTVPAVQSVYWWQGKVVSDQESMIIFKTTRNKYGELQAAIRSMHSYKVPEIIALPVNSGLPQYLDWVRAETTTRGEMK